MSFGGFEMSVVMIAIWKQGKQFYSPSGTETGKKAVESKSKRNLKRSASQRTMKSVHKLTRQFSVSVYTQKDLELKGDGAVAAVAYSPCFLNVALLVIVLNALWMLVDTEWNHVNLRGSDGRRPLQDISPVLENCFCSFFSIEILIRLFGFRRWRFMFKDVWFLFDLLLVILMILETWVLPLLSLVDSNLNSDALDNVALIRLFRLLRLGRIFRMLRFHPEMRLLVKSIARAMNAVFNILFLLVLVTYLFAIVFTSQLAKPGTERINADLSEASAKQLFADIVSSMLSLFTHGVLADELAFAFLAIKEDSVPLFWLFTVFVVFSGITLLNMLIGVLCQVVEDNSREHEKQKILVDLKSSLEEAFEALDTSFDGLVSEEEFQKMKTDPGVMEIFFRLGMEESAIIQRLDHMQETIFATKHEDPDESCISHSARPPSLSFAQFADQVVELQMNTAAGVLDVQMLASKVRAEDHQILTTLNRLEPDLHRLLEEPLEPQEAKTMSSLGLHTLNLTGEDSMPVRFPSTPLGCVGEASQASQQGPMGPTPEEETVHLPGALESRSGSLHESAAKASRMPVVGTPAEVPDVKALVTEDFKLREDWLQEAWSKDFHPAFRAAATAGTSWAQAEKLSSLEAVGWLRFGVRKRFAADVADNAVAKENLGGTDIFAARVAVVRSTACVFDMPRLRVLMLMNNRISRIAPDCFDPIPNIVSLVLTGNKLEKLVDLEPITQLKNLERLSLMDNPVTKVKHFRPYMIHKSSKTLRILDFNRIKDKERKAATLLFAGERGKKLLEEIAPPRVAGKEPTEKVSDVSKSGPSPEVIERIKKAIAEAETIEEVTRLEKALKSGVLPDDLKEPGTEGPEPAPMEGGPAPMAEG
ncbi:SNRPA1 [Symbiodinium natans]|uniref:SNRPA1 protein n=1 Tax=Symbiodinium natans TaxID=878477 RepID=A0A812RCA4_9DINO|nr:SNRPA1 [Symbiodinium natans]